MLAIFQNIGLPETFLVVVVAILVFGRRLPEVAARAAVHVQRARKAMTDLRRETGIDAELREARRAINEAATLAERRPFELARAEDTAPTVEREPVAPVSVPDREPSVESSPSPAESSTLRDEEPGNTAASETPQERSAPKDAEPPGQP